MAKSIKPQIIGHAWTLNSIWNQAMVSIPQRPLVKRSHIWASDLGKPFIDRYLKMHAIPYSTPANERSLRKFASGECWEWIVSIVLTVAGILKQKQVRGEVELPGLLKVTGKLDFVAGGVVDWEKAKSQISTLQCLLEQNIDAIPKIVFFAITHIAAAFEKKYGNNPLMEYVLEVKSISSFVSKIMEQTKKPQQHHTLQGIHYVIADKTIPELKLINLCKDDNIMHEFNIGKDKKILAEYKNDVSQMTEYYNASNHKNPLKTLPPKLPEVLFDEETFRFRTNFWLEWSDYLEFLYGFKTPDDYREKWKKTIPAWNSTFKRAAQGKNITALNYDRLNEMKKAFPLADDYIEKAKKSGVFDQPTENEDE